MRAATRHLVFPLMLIAALSATRDLLTRGSPPEAVFAIWLAAMPVVALLERWIPRHERWNRPHDDRLTDAIYLPATLVVGAGVSAAWAGVHLWLATALQQTVGSDGSSVWPSGWPLALQIAIACVVGELFAYWPHRWMHESPWLWRFHSVHHSARRVYWLNALRSHPGETVFRGSISSIPLAVLGTPPEVLAYWMVIGRIAGLFQHANIDFALGPFGWIFSIGELHRWHHSRDRAEADHNFGDTFIFWDGVFGTRYLPPEPAPERVGIAGLDAFPTRWWQQQLAPFRYGRIERASRGDRSAAGG